MTKKLSVILLSVLMAVCCQAGTFPILNGVLQSPLNAAGNGITNLGTLVASNNGVETFWQANGTVLSTNIVTGAYWTTGTNGHFRQVDQYGNTNFWTTNAMQFSTPTGIMLWSNDVLYLNGAQAITNGEAVTSALAAGVATNDVRGRSIATLAGTNDSATMAMLNSANEFLGTFTGSLYGNVIGNASTATYDVRGRSIATLAGTNDSATMAWNNSANQFSGTFTGSLVGNVIGNASTATNQWQETTISNNFTIPANSITNGIYSVISNCIVTLPATFTAPITIRNDSITNFIITNAVANGSFLVALTTNTMGYQTSITNSYSKRSMTFYQDNATNISMVWGERTKPEIQQIADAEVATQPLPGANVTGTVPNATTATTATYDPLGRVLSTMLDTNLLTQLAQWNVLVTTNSKYANTPFCFTNLQAAETSLPHGSRFLQGGGTINILGQISGQLLISNPPTEIDSYRITSPNGYNGWINAPTNPAIRIWSTNANVAQIQIDHLQITGPNQMTNLVEFTGGVYGKADIEWNEFAAYDAWTNNTDTYGLAGVTPTTTGINGYHPDLVALYIPSVPADKTIIKYNSFFEIQCIDVTADHWDHEGNFYSFCAHDSDWPSSSEYSINAAVHTGGNVHNDFMSTGNYFYGSTTTTTHPYYFRQSYFGDNRYVTLFDSFEQSGGNQSYETYLLQTNTTALILFPLGALGASVTGQIVTNSPYVLTSMVPDGNHFRVNDLLNTNPFASYSFTYKSNLNIGGNLTVTNSATVGGNLSVTGAVSIGGTITSSTNTATAFVASPTYNNSALFVSSTNTIYKLGGTYIFAFTNAGSFAVWTNISISTNVLVQNDPLQPYIFPNAGYILEASNQIGDAENPLFWVSTNNGVSPRLMTDTAGQDANVFFSGVTNFAASIVGGAVTGAIVPTNGTVSFAGPLLTTNGSGQVVPDYNGNGLTITAAAALGTNGAVAGSLLVSPDGKTNRWTGDLLWTNENGAPTLQATNPSAAVSFGGTNILGTVVSTNFTGNGSGLTSLMAADGNAVASKVQATNIAQSIVLTLNQKSNCLWATTSALPSNTYNNGASGVGATLTGVGVGALTVDGGAVNIGDSVLVNNEATAANNGIYVVTATGSGIAVYVLTRRADANQNGEVAEGDWTDVSQGTANTNTSWRLASQNPIVIGSSNITWVKFTGPITVNISGDGTATGSSSFGGGTINLNLVNTNAGNLVGALPNSLFNNPATAVGYGYNYWVVPITPVLGPNNNGFNQPYGGQTCSGIFLAPRAVTGADVGFTWPETMMNGHSNLIFEVSELVTNYQSSVPQSTTIIVKQLYCSGGQLILNAPVSANFSNSIPSGVTNTYDMWYTNAITLTNHNASPWAFLEGNTNANSALVYSIKIFAQ